MRNCQLSIINCQLCKMHFAFCILLAFIFFSCSESGDSFKIEGRFRNFNQGKFYIYSTDGGTIQMDTIKVQDGRFAYQTYLDKEATFNLVFPNYSEQVVFGKPGRKVSIHADATHLKEIEIKGTEENSLMTDFRESIDGSSPPDILKEVKLFVTNHPESFVCKYLITKYFISTPTPDYKTANTLIGKTSAARPDDISLKQLQNQLAILQQAMVSSRLPKFSVKDQNKKNVTQNFCKGKVGLIIVWASWNYDSEEMLRKARELKDEYGDKIAILSISLDASKYNCQMSRTRCNVDWPDICDGKMWETPIVKKLGISNIPDNIVIDRNGRIIARRISKDNLREEINTLCL